MLQRPSRLSKQKHRKILECFAADLSATQAAQVLGVNRNTINLWYRNFREQILEHLETSPTTKLSGEIELDESYFGGPRKKRHAADRRKRGRGAENKVPVFGVLKRDSKVYTQIIKNASKQELMPIVRQLIRNQPSIPINGKLTMVWCLMGININVLTTQSRTPIATVLTSME